MATGPWEDLPALFQITPTLSILEGCKSIIGHVELMVMAVECPQNAGTTLTLVEVRMAVGILFC
jgi:hypothetical protein